MASTDDQAKTMTARESIDTPSSVVPARFRHPHELAKSIPKGGGGCCRRATFECDGCGQFFTASSVTWYACSLQPTPCVYRICESCYHLGPAEGGIIQTASVTGFPEDKTTDEEKGLAQDTMLRRLSSADLADKATARTMSKDRAFPAEEVEVDATGTPAAKSSKRTGNNKVGNNNNKGAKGSSARCRSADADFKLKKDTAAQDLWKRFVETTISGTPAVEAAINLARKAVGQLNFLDLTVKDRNELQDEQVTREKKKCLELYSPYAQVEYGVKEEVIEAAKKIPQANRSMGCLLGMAVGDSVGAPFEFLDAVDEEGQSGSLYNLKTMALKGAKNKFKVKPGQWTDDTSMGLCLADTLLSKGTYDGSDVRVRYHNWWFRGYNNAFGNDSRIGSVGLGGNVAQSLRAMRGGERPEAIYKAVTQDAGNGTIMRLGPVPVFHFRNAKTAALTSAESSFATHPGPIAAAACSFQGFLIARAIQREQEMPASTFLEQVVQEFTDAGMPGANNCPELARLLASAEKRGGKEECWNWKAPKLEINSTLRARGHKYNGYPCTADYFGSYCIDGLAVALWSFYHTNNYGEAIVRCTNFLGDADTTSAICGQIAGAFYGYDAIDKRWQQQVEQWDDLDISFRGALLWALQEVEHLKASGLQNREGLKSSPAPPDTHQAV